MTSETPIRRIHHINFIYANLDHAVAQLERSLQLGPFEYDELPDRGVRTARVKLGETYLVLVSPVSGDSAPARYLQKHGEGFFLLSFDVEDLRRALDQLDGDAADTLMAQSRLGLDGWRVVDLTMKLPGCPVQLTESGKS